MKLAELHPAAPHLHAQTDCCCRNNCMRHVGLGRHCRILAISNCKCNRAICGNRPAGAARPSARYNKDIVMQRETLLCAASVMGTLASSEQDRIRRSPIRDSRWNKARCLARKNSAGHVHHKLFDKTCATGQAVAEGRSAQTRPSTSNCAPTRPSTWDFGTTQHRATT